MLAEFNPVQVGRAALAEQEDQFVTGAIEAAHPASLLVPYDQVQPIQFGGGRRSERVLDMPVIHAVVDQATIDQVLAGSQHHLG
nr:hypothetical protein [Brevundimonas sp.]